MGYDVTLGFFGVSASFSFAIDDNLNIAAQSAYPAPTYIDPEAYHTGLADVGIACSLQLTDDGTVYDLEGPGCYAGVSAGAGPSFGFDMVYSGVEAMNRDHAEKQPNGIAVSVGYGIGIDTHFKQTKTQTMWSTNIKELFR